MAGTKEVVVMDVGSSKIRLLAVEKPNKNMLSVRKIVQESYDGYFRGEWCDGENTAQAITAAVSQMRDYTKIRKLYVAVPSEFCTVRTARNETVFGKRRRIERADMNALFPKANPFVDDMTKLVINQSAIYYELDGGRKNVDPEGEVTSELTGYLSFIACERRVIDFFNSVFKRLGITDVDYVCGTYAAMLYAFPVGVRDTVDVLAIDAGYLSSTVALMRGDGLINMTSFACGKGLFVAWMSDYFDLPFEAAEALYDKTDLSYTPKDTDVYSVDVPGEDGKLHETQFSISKVQNFVGESIAQFAAYTQAAVDSFAEPRCNSLGMSLMGGCLSNRGALDCFRRKLNREVKFVALESCPEYKKPVYAATIGIAHYAFLQEEKKRHRFLW